MRRILLSRSAEAEDSMGVADFMVAGASMEEVDFTAVAGFTEMADSVREVASAGALLEDTRGRVAGRTEDLADSKTAPSAKMHVETSMDPARQE